MLSGKHSIPEKSYKLLCELLLFLPLSMAITLVFAYFHTTLFFLYINRFHAIGLFLYPPENISKTISFLIFTVWYRKQSVARNRLKSIRFTSNCLAFDLTTGKYKPYNKPGNIPLYINVKSNHPPNIIKNLPDSISRRINKLSSDKNVFENSKDIYNNALFNSGFKQKIKFDPNFGNNNSQNKNRKRNIIWFNPPYSNNVLTNIGKSFLTILDKHFPKSHRLHRIFNRNNVKISYSAMPNFASVINSHNKKIINDNIVKPTTQSCNCRTKTS